MYRLIEFFSVFILCYLVYLFGIILRKKKNKFDPKKLKVEEAYLISKYNLDMKKINYKKYLNLVAISNSLIFSITVQIVTILNGIMWQLLFSIVILTPLIVLVYSLIGKYYIKKGYVIEAKIIDESDDKKPNTKNEKKKKHKKIKKERSDKNV